MGRPTKNKRDDAKRVSSKSSSSSVEDPRPERSLSLPDIGGLRLEKKDIKRFHDLLRERSGGNNLYELADQVQAATAIQSALSVQATYDLLRTSTIDVESVDDLYKLIQSINRASASVNTSLRQMGLVGATREGEVDTDSLAEFLSGIDLDKHCPPHLEESYIQAEADVKRTETGAAKTVDGKTAKEMIEEVRKPIKTYSDLEGKDVVGGDTPSKEEEIDMTGKRIDILA